MDGARQGPDFGPHRQRVLTSSAATLHSARMKILQIAGSLNPSTGGPIEGVLQSFPWLTCAGHEVELLTLDDPGAPFLQSSRIPVHAVGPVHSGYAYTPRLAPWLRRNLRRYDIAVVHGVWQYLSFAVWRAARRLGVPYV